MITDAVEDVPVLTADQMREVDRAMVEDLHIELVQMMESAGRSLAELAIARFAPASVTVLAGPGGNDGGGLVAARHLANRGRSVCVAPSEPDSLTAVPAHQVGILRRMGVVMTQVPAPADLVVDALIGYSLRGDPTGRTATLIERATSSWPRFSSSTLPAGLMSPPKSPALPTSGPRPP